MYPRTRLHAVVAPGIKYRHGAAATTKLMPQLSALRNATKLRHKGRVVCSDQLI